MKISILCPDLSINCLVRPYLLAKILQRHYEVEIIGPVSGEGIWGAVADDKSLHYKHIEFRGRFRPYWKLSELPGMIEGDVVYACKPLLTSFGVGLVNRMLHKRPLVLDIEDWERGFIQEYYRHLSCARRLRYLVASSLFTYTMGSYWNIVILEKLVGYADEITVSNHFLQQKFGGSMIWHARDTDAFDPAKYDGDAMRDKFGIGKDKKVLMFSGTPRPHKGVEDAIDAVLLLGNKDVVLIVVGMGPDQYCRQLEDIGKDKLAERFIGLDLQPFEKVPEILAMADVAVMPQKRSPATVGQIPAKVFDAMAMAKPVVATRVSDLPEILEGCGWIVEPDSPRELADTIGRVLADPAEAGEMGRRARRKCVERYSWDAMEKVLVTIFDKYTRGNSRPAKSTREPGTACRRENSR